MLVTHVNACDFTCLQDNLWKFRTQCICGNRSIQCQRIQSQKAVFFCISLPKVEDRIFSYFLAFSQYLNFNRVNLQGHDLFYDFHFIASLDGRCFGSNYSAFPFPVIARLSFSKFVKLLQASIMIRQFHELNTFFLHFIASLEGKREDASEATTQQEGPMKTASTSIETFQHGSKKAKLSVN